MNKVKCAKGHFFDADKFSSCPTCSSMEGEPILPPLKRRKIKKAKCTNGHYFNAYKFSNCPICGSSVKGSTEMLPWAKKAYVLIRNNAKGEPK